MTDRVFIKDLRVRGIIGVYDRERLQPQEILINIIIEIDLHLAGETDEIQNCIDYDALSQKVVALVEKNQRRTVEALAEDIAQISLAEPMAESVQVRVEKPAAVQFAQSAGVEINRKRIP